MIAQSLLQQTRLVALIGAFIFIVSLTLYFPTSRLCLPGEANGLRPSPVALDEKSAPPENQYRLWDLQIPNDYFDSRPQSDFCAHRFSAKYLEDLRDHVVSYCQPKTSQSSLTCFHSHTSLDGEADSLCVARGASLDAESQRFRIHCLFRPLSLDEQSAGLEPFDSIRGYWYGTGPAEIFSKFITFLKKPVPLNTTTKRTEKDKSTINRDVTVVPQNYLLIKREGETNPWHSLLEVWSA